MLEIAYLSFKNSKFSGEHAPRPLRVLSPFQRFIPISAFYPHFSVLSPFQRFIPISAFYPHFSVLSPFQRFIPISAFYPHFSVLSPFQRFIPISAFYPHFSFRFQFPFPRFSFNVLSLPLQMRVLTCAARRDCEIIVFEFPWHDRQRCVANVFSANFLLT